MAYQIMIAKAQKSNYLTLWQYLTTTTDGETTPVEMDTKDELDARVEKMLNSGYAKSDFIVVVPIDYDVEATNYSDDEEEEEEEEEDSTGDADDDTTTDDDSTTDDTATDGDSTDDVTDSTSE